LKKKRRLRIDWHRLRPESKRSLTATQELKELLNKNKNDYIQTFLQGLTPTESTDYFLCVVTKKLEQVKKTSPIRISQGTWAKSNVEKPRDFDEPGEEEALIQLRETPLSTRTTNQPPQKS
jgi:hypothetical protein